MKSEQTHVTSTNTKLEKTHGANRTSERMLYNSIILRNNTGVLSSLCARECALTLVHKLPGSNLDYDNGSKYIHICVFVCLSVVDYLTMLSVAQIIQSRMIG
jgi:hypothetical protein